MGQCPERHVSISVKEQMCLLSVHSNRQLTHYGFYARVFSIINDLNIPVELLLTSDNCVTMAIETSTASEKSLNKAQVELQAYSRIALLGDMVMLSVHITSKDYSSEMLSPIFSILSACCIPVHLISYGM
jgi:aspartokinase